VSAWEFGAGLRRPKISPPGQGWQMARRKKLDLSPLLTLPIQDVERQLRHVLAGGPRGRFCRVGEHELEH